MVIRYTSYVLVGLGYVLIAGAGLAPEAYFPDAYGRPACTIFGFIGIGFGKFTQKYY